MKNGYCMDYLNNYYRDCLCSWGLCGTLYAFKLLILTIKQKGNKNYVKRFDWSKIARLNR